MSEKQPLPIRIVLPFKDHKFANAVRQQLADLGQKINADITPVYTCRKIKDEFRVKEDNNKTKIVACDHGVIYNFTSQNYEPMSSMGNAFVVCGVIYCIDSHGSRSTAINFAYDTKTGRQWNPNIPFTNQYGHNSMVDYNPREKVLYAWDARRQVTYSLAFEEH